MGIIAGGHKAILSAVENVEDNKAQGAMDLQNLNFSNRDVLVGLAASGRTPYVIGAMEYAHSQNAFVAIVSCNPHGEMAQLADVAITPVVGPEVVTGSTRLKAGTAQKLVLNMISTGASEKYKICMDYDLFARFYRGGRNFNLSIQLLVASRMVEHRVDIRFRQSRKIYPLRKSMA